MKLIYVFCLVAPISVWGTCKTKINPSKVILFIDTNQSALEIASAQKAACLRGERLEVVPSNYKQYAVLEKAISDVSKKIDECIKKPNPDCATNYLAARQARNKMEDFAKEQTPIADQVVKKLQELNKQKVSLTNVSISGHNGGGSFHGSKGGYSRSELSEDILKFPAINKVESVVLMGCYTGVQSEVAAWKSMFPKLKLVAGYDGSAPNSLRIAGHKYLEDILEKEKKLLKINDPSKLDSDIKSMLGTLGEVNSAVSINPACSNKDGISYYYASMLDRTFHKMDPKACEKGRKEIYAIVPQFQKFKSGELEPPKDTVNGELRKIYNLVRTYAHCMEDENGYSPDINVNEVFNLLFWHDLKQNFAEYYKDDLKETDDIIGTIRPETIIAELDKSLASIESQKAVYEAKLKSFTENPKAFGEALELLSSKSATELNTLMDDPRVKTYYARTNTAGYQPTAEEKVLIGEIMKKQSSVMQASHDLSRFKYSQKEFAQDLKMSVVYKTQEIERTRNFKDEMSQNPEKAFKIWTPNKVNLEKKSRKEILQNNSNIMELLGMQALNPKQRGAVNFIQNTTFKHFEYYANPFSWHEYRGRPEAPRNPRRLAEYLDSANSNPYSIVGGINGGMGGGIGIVQDGYQQQQPQQQIQQQNQQRLQQQQQVQQQNNQQQQPQPQQHNQQQGH